MTTGRDLLAQVRKALNEVPWRGSGPIPDRAAALDGCVLLTRKEADLLIDWMSNGTNASQWRKARALLTEPKEGE